jgi:hypothetical protein
MEIGEINRKNVSNAVAKLASVFKHPRQECDPGEYFDEEYFRNPSHHNHIVDKLLDKHYFVKNRYNKYYVIAFAINYTRFEVYSKDCDKELIEWRDEALSVDDPIKGVITNPDYNENPVITFLKCKRLNVS